MSNTAIVTKSLIAINILIWIMARVRGDHFVIDLELIGRANDAGEIVGVAAGPDQWYRLITAVFLHQDPGHIALNMLSLWWIGAPLEQALGRSRYLALYLLSGLGGAAFSFLLATPETQSLGASGAIFGLLGGIGVLVKRLGGDLRPIGAVLALNLIFTFTWANIDWRAHIGGLVFGALVAFGMVHAPRPHQTRVQVLTCVAALALVVIMVWIGTVRITG